MRRAAACLAALLVACGHASSGGDEPQAGAGGEGAGVAGQGSGGRTAQAGESSSGRESAAGATATPGGAAGAQAGSSACPEGDTRACVGPGACAGGQVCRSGAWLACDCGLSGAGGIGGATSGGQGSGGTTKGGSGGSGGTAGSDTPRRCNFLPSTGPPVDCLAASYGRSFCDEQRECVPCALENTLDCNGDGRDGCESRAREPEHCGDCVTVCTVTEQCRGETVVLPSGSRTVYTCVPP